MAPSRDGTSSPSTDALAIGESRPWSDRGGFERAVRQVWPTLFSIASAVLGRRNDAEDVVQEAVIVALGKESELPAVNNFTAWMGQIVRFVALNRRRSARLRETLGEESLQHVGVGQNARVPNAAGMDGLTSVDPHGQLRGGEFAFDDRLLHALLAIDEIPRACLLLRVVNELSYKEIGHALDIPEGTAMSHVFRARRFLMEKLGATQS